MKYLIVIGDGMADRPMLELGGKTVLEVARTPNLDFIARNGLVGYVRTVPRGMTPGSDVANLSIFGYDPKKYYTGRGPLEAASLGVNLKKDEVAFRCNLVYVADGIMQDFTAGHISTEEAVILLDDLQKQLKPKDVCLVPGLSYRHLAIIKNGPEKAICTPPHDITDKEVKNYLPRGPRAKQLKDLMQASAEILPRHALNQRRIQNQKSPANMIWLWGQGKNPALPLFKKLYGKTAAVITAVHLLKGIGRLSGMEVIDVPGATGFVDTNYAGKTQAAIEALQTVDAVFLHVEAPDECGHMGNLKLKKQAIEDFDRLIVGRLLSDLKKFGEYAVLALPDHPTPLAVKTHTDDPVPFAMYKTRWESKCKLPRAEEVNAYNEKAAEESGWFVSRGDELLRTFFEL